MAIEKSSFADLEQQMASDSLETALKRLHEEINREIAKNKNDFSTTIQKTLTEFRQNLEKSISEEIDKKLSILFENNFYAINQDVTKSFEKAFSPVLENVQNDMKRLHIQGESTLNSWKDMMSQYKALWTRPIFIMFSASILTGLVISLISSYFLMRQQNAILQQYESALTSYKELAYWYWEKDKAREERDKSVKSSTKSNKTQNNKK